MRVASFLAVGATAVLLLVGCAPASPEAKAPAQSTSDAPSAAPVPTPTIDPGPVVLTKEQAGERYLNLMCQRNDLIIKIAAALNAKEDEYLNGGTPDATEVKSVAAEALRVNRVTVELIDDPYYTWPGGTGELLQVIKGSLLGEATTFDVMANASSYEAAYTAPSNTVDVGSAPQELRYELGLSSDTAASCKGLETAADALHAEMQERSEYLASFTTEE